MQDIRMFYAIVPKIIEQTLGLRPRRVARAAASQRLKVGAML